MDWRDEGGPLPKPPWWFVDIVLSAVSVVPAFIQALPEELRPTTPFGWVCAVLPAIVLPLRRRWPVTALVVLLLLFTLVSATGLMLPGIGFAVAVAVFHIASRTNRRTSVVVALVVICVMALVSVIAAIAHDLDPRVFQFVVTVAFASAAGDATRSRREYLHAITERARRAEETRESEAQRRVVEERLRIARDLHDTVAHQISVISLNAGVASSALDARPEEAREALGRIRSASRTVLGEIGGLLRHLRAEDGGTTDPERPQGGLERLDDLVEDFTRTGLEVGVRVEGDPTAIGGIAGLVAYRVVQEGLTNAQKHGTGDRAHLLLSEEERTLTIVVTNPIVPGAPESSDGSGSGHGLVGLRERVGLLGGAVETGRAPGGYRLAVRIPAPVGEEGEA